MDKKKLLVIVGPTAIGKTALSIEIAKKFQGEIISADSSQVYRYMDIGTAKATKDEMQNIPHHLIDAIEPNQAFSVQEFQHRAIQKIVEIYERGHLPIIAGGTGLYIESVTHGYSMPDVPTNHEFRDHLHQLACTEGNNAVYKKLKDVDPVTAARLHPNDQNRIVRALEVYEALGQPISSVTAKREPLYNTLWVGLKMPREQLYERINMRVNHMLKSGLVDEVASLKEKGYHRDLTSMQAIGYKEIMSYLEGEISLDTAVEWIKQGTRRYAKRQLTWFRRLSEIHWFDVTKEGVLSEIQRLVEGKFFLQRE